MKKIISSILAAGALVISAQANAGLIEVDFKALANASGDIGEAAYTSFDLNPYGLDIAVTGSVLGGETDAYVYFDHGNAGIGVCGKVFDLGLVNTPSNSSNNNCDPGSDDGLNFANGEVLAFENTGTIAIWMESLFLNANHDSEDILDAVALLNGEDVVALAGAPADSLSGTGDVRLDLGFYLDPGKIFSFAFTSFPNAPSGAYISGLTAHVPEPGSLALLGLGLAGLGLTRRRKA